MPTLLPSHRTKLEKLMSDPRYWDTQHPEHTEVLANVQRAFQDAYPEKTSDDNTTAGTVHVRAYTRRQDGQVMEVSEYDRTQKIAFRGPPPLDKRRDDAIDDVSNNPFHDFVQNVVAAAVLSMGGSVEKDVHVYTVEDDIMAIPDVVGVLPDGTRIVVEVKTGKRPRFTPNQPPVYTLMEQGYQVYSTDPKMERLGFKKGQPLPPFCVYTAYLENLFGKVKIKPFYEACCTAGSNKFN